MSIIPICGVCGQYFARKELGCPNCSAKEEEQNRINKLEMDYQSKREDLIKIKDLYRRDLNELAITLNTLEKKSNELNTQVNTYESQLNTLQNDIATSKQNISSLEVEIKTLMISYDTKIKQRDELASNLSVIISKEQDLRKRLEKRKTELETIRVQKLEEAQKLITTAKDEKSRAEAEYKKLELAHLEAEKNIEANKLAKEQLEGMLSELKNLVLSPSQVLAFKNEKESLENELKSTSDMLKRMQEDYNSKSMSSNEAINKLSLMESELLKSEE